jgi:hypothetical protein
MEGSDTRLYAKLFNLLKSCETELIAYRMVYEAMQASGNIPDLAPSLRAAKEAVRCQMDEKYEQAINKLSMLQGEQEILQALDSLQCGELPN